MHVVVNAAMSADGKLSTRERTKLSISGPADFDRVDRLRAESDAIAVGIGTVLADNPSLTVKSGTLHEDRVGSDRPANPARVVVDSRGRTPVDASVLDDEAETYVLVSETAPIDRRSKLADRGATLITAGERRVDPLRGFAALQEAGLEQIMVEGGGELIFSLFADGLVDELLVFVGPLVVGGRDAPTVADGEGFLQDFPALTLSSVDELDDGVLLNWTVDG